VLSDTPGIHHVSAIAGDPQRNHDFYADTLGLRFLVRTVNFEDQFVYHLYYGDRSGTPGSVITAFAYPRESPGRTGRPGIVATSLRVPPNSLGYWRNRLADRGVDHDSPTERFGERILPLRDPDGLRLELVESDAAAVSDPAGGISTASHTTAEAGETEGASTPRDTVPSTHAIQGIRGVSVRSASPFVTASILDTFGFELVDEQSDAVRYRLPDDRESVVDLLTDDAPYGREGRGSIHHVAFSVESEAALHEWRDLLAERGFDVSRVKDRHFFHSLYVRDPGGVLFELATESPGLGVADREPAPSAELWLPPWLEADRGMIEDQLPPLAGTGGNR